MPPTDEQPPKPRYVEAPGGYIRDASGIAVASICASGLTTTEAARISQKILNALNGDGPRHAISFRLDTSRLDPIPFDAGSADAKGCTAKVQSTLSATIPMPNDDDPTCDVCGGPLLPEAEQVAVLREVLAQRHKSVPPLRAGMVVRHRYPDQSDEPMASHPAVIERLLTPAEIAARSEGGLAANDMRIFVAPRGIAMSFFCESAEYEPHPDFNRPEAAH